ncbi:MAG: hypothetical protein P8Y53_12985, partial [Pseudolabrys sp.]
GARRRAAGRIRHVHGILPIAAWRALYQLIVSPYAWEKTEHGLAKRSRRAEATTRSLVALERHLDSLVKSGELPAVADHVASEARRNTPQLKSSPARAASG